MDYTKQQERAGTWKNGNADVSEDEAGKGKDKSKEEGRRKRILEKHLFTV